MCKCPEVGMCWGYLRNIKWANMAGVEMRERKTHVWSEKGTWRVLTQECRDQI